MRMEKRTQTTEENRRNAPKRLQRADWVAAALRRLAASGVEAVRIELLARDLKVTKGSFYWHFKDRPELLEAVLQQWEATTELVTAPVPTAETPSERMDRFLARITASAADPFEAALENAVLAWAQNDAAVAERVAAIETRRTTNAEQLLAALGFAPDDAALWADIGYTTFVGMMNRSTRDPRFRQWPQTGYLKRILEAAQAQSELEP